MGFFDSIEKSVEGAVNSVFSKISARDLKPVDFVVAIKQNCDEKTIEVGEGKKVAPNNYTIELSTFDFDKVVTWSPEEFANELVAAVNDHALGEGYSFIGEVVVTFEENTELETGVFNIVSESVRTKVPDATPEKHVFEDASISMTSPSIEVDGKRYALTKPITIVGRGSTCDIILNDAGVSRKHLELRVTPNATIASDLGSTNKIYIDGQKTVAATLVDGNTVTLGNTKITYFAPKAMAAVANSNGFDSNVDADKSIPPASIPVSNPVTSLADTPPDPFQELNLSLPLTDVNTNKE